MSNFPASPFRENILSDQVVLITGGGSGIGYEIGHQLGLHGAAVCIMGRRLNVLEAAVETMKKDGIRAGYCQGDVRDFESCKRAVTSTVEQFGKLSMLVNNAAGNFLAPAENLSAKGFATVMEIDSFGMFHMSTAAFPHLKRAYESQGDANILNITAEFNLPPFFQIHAAAAKMAINSMTKSFALEWADHGIRCNGIAPGPIANTTGMDKLSGMGGSDPNAKMSAAKDLPRGLGLGMTWDIAMAAVFYASKAGGYVSGDIMVMDGGGYLRNGLRRNKDGSLNLPREAIINASKSREREQRKNATGVAGQKSKL